MNGLKTSRPTRNIKIKRSKASSLWRHLERFLLAECGRESCRINEIAYESIRASMSSREEPPNQTLHSDRGRILVSRDTTPLQRPRRVNTVVRPAAGWHALRYSEGRG